MYLSENNRKAIIHFAKRYINKPLIFWKRKNVFSFIIVNFACSDRTTVKLPGEKISLNPRNIFLVSTVAGTAWFGVVWSRAGVGNLQLPNRMWLF